MDMKKLMKQMQQAQAAAGKIQDQLAAQTVEGSAGGLVNVTMNGHGKIQSLSIQPQALEGSDAEALEDLILVALKDAESRADDLQRQATQSLGLPGGMF